MDSDPSEPRVELARLSKRFGDVEVVRDLDLAIADNEFFTLVGPSGCGKTTTLRMIAGFEKPTAGRVLIDGEDVTGRAAHRRPTNTVFQSYALFPHLTVGANVAFGLRRSRLPRDVIGRRVAAELARVRFAGQEHRRPEQLSGGQQQRVALARALVNRPKVLLLDEPLGALDLKLRKELQIELKEIQREVGITFVYVTHDQEEALGMSDRIGVMNAGRIEQLGTPAEIYRRPSSSFVAGFVGVSNLIPATAVRPGDNGDRVRLDSGVEFDTPTGGLAVGERCWVVVRPEHVALHPTADSVERGRPSMSGRVDTAVYLGTATQVVVRLPDGTEMKALVSEADGDLDAAVRATGAEVVLSWAPGDVHVIGA